RRRLGEATFDAVWAAGTALSLDDAVADALKEEAMETDPALTRPRLAAASESDGYAPAVAGARAGAPPHRLSPRELEVARLIADGLSNQEIAVTLMVSVRTAATHVEHILNKLGLHRRAQIAAW